MRFRVGALTLFLAGAFLAAPLAADAQQGVRKGSSPRRFHRGRLTRFVIRI
jgi:hypothetical protein